MVHGEKQMKRTKEWEMLGREGEKKIVGKSEMKERDEGN